MSVIIYYLLNAIVIFILGIVVLNFFGKFSISGDQHNIYVNLNDLYQHRGNVRKNTYPVN